MKTKGLIIGKFYPFHHGHEFLLKEALKYSHTLYMIICYKNTENPHGDLRKSWVNHLFPQVNVSLLFDSDYNPDDSKLWAELTVNHLGFVPDIVFTSEDYGENYCKYLNCKHVLVDKQRKAYPISGTKIRNNPIQYYQYISDPIKEYYCKRVVILGPESTGKTTLCERISKDLNTNYVEEYGREYSKLKMIGQNEKIEYNWESNDFLIIANKQNSLENKYTSQSNGILICDTNSFATYVWHLRYMGFENKELKEVVLNQKPPDLIFLTKPDVEFVQDGTRDGEFIREKMFDDFVTLLKKFEFEYFVLDGDYEDRYIKAMLKIKERFNIII